MEIRELKIEGYERVAACVEGGYRGFIAVHSTKLGPAVGGTRFWKYENDEAAVKDLLRLARGMTYKNALAGLPLGGGKSIVLRSDGEIDREMIFRAHARFIDTSGESYISE